MRLISRYILTASIVTVSSLMGAVQSETFKADINNLTSQQIAKQNKIIVKMAAEEMSKTLPQTVDKYTALVSVKADGTTLEYSFDINTGAKSDNTVIMEDKKRMKKAIIIGICRSSLRFLEGDINIKYIYQSAKSKKELFNFLVTKQDCPERNYK